MTRQLGIDPAKNKYRYAALAISCLYTALLTWLYTSRFDPDGRQTTLEKAIYTSYGILLDKNTAAVCFLIYLAASAPFYAVVWRLFLRDDICALRTFFSKMP
jgi:hypothetical protein